MCLIIQRVCLIIVSYSSRMPEQLVRYYSAEYILYHPNRKKSMTFPFQYSCKYSRNQRSLIQSIKQNIMNLHMLIVALLYLLFVENSSSNCELDCCRTLKDRLPMKFTFYQDIGRFVGGRDEYFIETMGYSEHGEGYLNPAMQCAPGDIGPLPSSTYKLAYCKNVMHQTVQRPCSFYLDSMRPADLCGRQDFFIHGCNCCGPQDDSEPPVLECSNGCIVINYDNCRKLRLGDIITVEQYDAKKVIASQ